MVNEENRAKLKEFIEYGRDNYDHFRNYVFNGILEEFFKQYATPKEFFDARNTTQRKKFIKYRPLKYSNKLHSDSDKK